jgi:hypothetical protein
MTDDMRPLDPQRLGPAIAILTAWANSPNDVQLTGDVLLSYIEEDIPEDRLVTGLIGLAGILLVQLEKATGTPAPELMADLARRYMT